MPSLRAAYAMTFSEYLLRVEGWHREQKRQAYRDRRTWFNQLWGSHLNAKALPRTEEAYMPIDGDIAPKMTETMKGRWDKAVAEYNQKKKKNG